MTERLREYRRAVQAVRHRQEGLSPAKPILTGTARRGHTPSDLEALETVSVAGQAANGSLPFLAGYDDVPAYP